MATLMWMPRVLARIAAGTSAARVNRAVLRPCRGLIPRAWSRWARASSVSALPGRRPGNSQGEGTLSRLLPGALRPAASLVDEGVQRGGQHDRAAAQAQEGAAVLVQDVLGCQGGDVVELLGVEQDEEPGDPVGGRAGVVVEEPARVCPPAVLVKRPGRAGPARGRSGEAGGVAAGDRPADEVRRPGEVAGGPGQPLVEVGLGAGGQGQPALPPASPGTPRRR